MPTTRFLTDREIYESAVLKLVPSARKRLWIATADIKDMYVEKPGLTKQMVPFLQILAELLRRGVAVRQLVAKRSALLLLRGTPASQ